MKTGDKYKIDSYRVSQYENERVVDVVSIIEPPTKYQKKILVHSPKLQSSILVFRSDLKSL